MDLNRLVFKYIFFSTLKLRREWFLPYLGELEKSQYWSEERLKGYQLSRLNSLLSHAYLNIPHYARRVPKKLNSLSELSELPLLGKEDLRNDAPSLIWKKGVQQRYKTSGGSTGAPVTLLKDSKGMAQELAATWRGYGWAGVTIGDRQARFWGVPKNSRDRFRSELIDFVCNRKRISAFGYGKDYFRESLNRLSKFKPDYFYGYVSILREFADFIDSDNVDCCLKPNSIITTSEVLTAIDRVKLERVFGARVFDEYGCGEIGTITHECDHGKNHINSENIILELLDGDGNAVKLGEPGEVVVTDLTNFSMPLIRYRLKDFGVFSDETCSCGRTLPILEKVYGRQYDALINLEGKCFHGEFFLYIVEDAKKNGISVDGIQFVQNPDLSILINVVANDSCFLKFRDYALKRLRSDFDKDISLKFEKTSLIKREQSGKLRVVMRINEQS